MVRSSRFDRKNNGIIIKAAYVEHGTILDFDTFTMWPRMSKMLTQPCTNLDRHRAPRRAHDPFYNVRRRVHKWNCPEQRAKMWVSAIFELTSRVYRAKTRSAIWSRKCRGKTSFYKRAFSTSTRSFPLGALTRLLRYITLNRAKITDTWSNWRSQSLI